ncbi:MAG: hypothetical protein SF053_09320 [Bacteroidia bacterium]|nr:hypothetical protein [Bacteroidia bacterium]
MKRVTFFAVCLLMLGSSAFAQMNTSRWDHAQQQLLTLRKVDKSTLTHAEKRDLRRQKNYWRMVINQEEQNRYAGSAWTYGSPYYTPGRYGYYYQGVPSRRYYRPAPVPPTYCPPYRPARP